MPAATAIGERPHALGSIRAPIRVLIVDDSVVARAVISRMIEAEPDLVVVGQAANGRGALDLLATGPVDVIILDLVMPGCCGLAILPALIAAGGRARVLVVSSSAADGAETTVSALRLGAADTLLKPKVGFGRAFAEMLVDRVRGLVPDTDLLAPVPSRVQPIVANAGPPGYAIDCVAIGASTGGIHALAAFFGAYPATLDAPILVTQHLPASFMIYFARQLADMAGRPARIAEDGMPIRLGEILLAPGDASLSLRRTRGLVHVLLERQRAPSGCLPSADPMLAAVGAMYGAGAIGIVLSGMGRDGLDGARALSAAGGTLLAQDAATSVVWGMPGAVAQAGLATAVMPPDRLARRIGAMARTGRKAA